MMPAVSPASKSIGNAPQGARSLVLTKRAAADGERSVLLGIWCAPERRIGSDAGVAAIFPSVWSDPQKVGEAYVYVTGVCERLLGSLSIGLNKLHGAEHSERFWRIIVGAWLHWYVSAMYDRYVTLTAALQEYPESIISGMASECFVTPADTEQFATLVYEHPYNLQLYSRVLEFLGRDFTRDHIAIAAGESWSAGDGRKLSWRGRGRDWFMRALSPRPAIVAKSVFFPKPVQARIVAGLLGRLRFMSQTPVERPLCFPDPGKRKALADCLAGTTDFERLVAGTIALEMPTAYVECHETIRQKALRSYPARPKVIFSANSWYYDEEFKAWAAACADEGTLLLGTQHGGNYGSQRDMFSEAHELRIVDGYYSWGWTAEGRTQGGAVTPMPATRLAGRGEIGCAPADETAILYGATSMPTYVMQFPHVPSRFYEYLEWQRRFAVALAPALRQNLRLRAHYYEPGWQVVNRWTESFPEIQVEEWSVSFWDSLKKCRVYVCDHCSTTFTEALAANKPTILYWDPVANEMRDAAKPYYDALRRVGILHDSPEAAASAVAAVYPNVPEWWNGTELQRVRREFCQRFARTVNEPVSEWIQEFRRVMKSKKTTA